MGFRFVAARGTNTLPRWKGSTIPDEMCETTAEYLDDCQRLLALYHDPEPFSMRQIVLAPCQPINCTEDTFLETIRLARSAGVHMHTHLCEGENSSMVRRFGVRSLEWCRRIGFVGSDIWLAHGRETLPEEYALLAENHMGISHCPAPTMLGGSEILDIPGMRKAGIPISLGVDGCATNDGSNMLDTLRLAYLMQTFLSKKRGGCPSPYEMLKLATVGGAEMIGRPELGQLAAGKAADLFMIDARRLEYAGALHDPRIHACQAGVTGPVWLTMINGRVVYRDDHLTGVDETKLLQEGEQVCTLCCGIPARPLRPITVIHNRRKGTCHIWTFSCFSMCRRSSMSLAVPFTSRYLQHNRSMAGTRGRRTGVLSTISPAQSWCC